jgi:hypothetical protein
MKNKLKDINSPYIELEKNGNVYVMSTDKPNIYKIGRSINIEKRKNHSKQLKSIKLKYYMDPVLREVLSNARRLKYEIGDIRVNRIKCYGIKNTQLK